MRPRSDAALLQSDDAAAFRELYDRYAERVDGFHFQRCHDEHAAHDLAAETFAQAWVSRRRFRDEAAGSAGPWLFGIARNVLLASVRKGRLERRACERLSLLDALDAAGAFVLQGTYPTEWECYLGPAAVDQKIISADFLGEVQTAPAVG